MNDLKGIIEDCNKSDLVSDKIIKKVIEIIGQEEWQDLHDENNDICTTMGELIITLKGIAELEHQLTHRNCLDCSNHSSKLRMRTLELEKENAELKGIKDVATLIRANNDTVVTLMQLNNKLVSKNQQLTKAKEIINRFIQWNYGCCDIPDYKDIVKQAEQFLKEIEK